MAECQFGTCVEFGPTQLPVGLGLGLGLGPNLIDRKLGGPEPDTSAANSVQLYKRDSRIVAVARRHCAKRHFSVAIKFATRALMADGTTNRYQQESVRTPST